MQVDHGETLSELEQRVRRARARKLELGNARTVGDLLDVVLARRIFRAMGTHWKAVLLTCVSRA